MEKEAARLSSCAVVLDLCRGQGDVEPEEVNKALRVRFGVQRGDVKVSRHQPENFLAVFKYPHHRDAAVALERLPVGNLDFRIWPWCSLPYGDHCDLRHHVRLCLEGIPAHAWNESIAKRVVARVCDLDYVEARSLRRDDTRALCLWAWTYNPSDIPKRDGDADRPNDPRPSDNSRSCPPGEGARATAAAPTLPVQPGASLQDAEGSMTPGPPSAQPALHTAASSRSSETQDPPDTVMPCPTTLLPRNRRFRPNCVYVRRKQRTTTTALASAPAQQSAAASFIDTVTLQTAKPVLQGPPQRAVAARRRKRQPSAPQRKSVRVAAASWPRGDAQAKARQVLMKKLGFVEDEDRSADDALLGYFKLFSGPTFWPGGQGTDGAVRTRQRHWCWQLPGMSTRDRRKGYIWLPNVV
ncbi:unnamed protein product [Miscanthus lutarioriparius]|uniref:DUF4283 domain-containing protein n=1 Tax=Miscanthus lutarioriparius TaxID=422564 RepID=A0A811MJT0_9POAL|nr:unnamed protein product [Miscanthus lutarioriparius]